MIFLYWCNNIKIKNNPEWNIISVPKTGIQSQEERLYQNKKEWFSLKIVTWRKIQEDTNWLLVFITSPQKQWDTIKENLWINVDQKSDKKTAEEYYLQQKQGIENHIKDYKEISKEEYKIWEEKWLKIIYKWILWNNKLQRQQIILYKNWKIFLITYTATQETFNEYIDQINNIINSIKF